MIRFNTFVLKLLNPLIFIFFNFFAALFAYKGYIIDTQNDLCLYFFVLLSSLFLFLFVIYMFSYTNVFDKDISLSGIYWTFISFVIVFSNIVEYLYFGIPLLSLFGFGKTVVYAEYGFPLIHHIAVSSWIIIFIKNKNKLFLIFALINPLLIVNRDLIIFTIFCFVIKKILNKRNTRVVFIAFIFVVLLFVSLGNLRSGSTALFDTGLPIKSEVISENSVLLWLFTYFTCSYFNFFSNIFSKSFDLQFININTFPESYNWFISFDFFGIMIFFILTFIILLFLSKSSKKVFSFKVLYIYLLYNSIMTLFGNKFFTTNTIFVVCIFLFEKFLFISVGKKYHETT